MLLIALILLPFIHGHPPFSVLDYLKPKVSDEIQTKAVKNLLIRLIPNHAEKFIVKIDKEFVQNGNDVFQLQKLENGSVLIVGTTGVSASTGFNHYLKYYCFGQIGWQTFNVNIPDELPHVSVTVPAKDRFRYYQNVCTASYTFTWWNWEEWEKHIDWIALNSYNLVLSFNGLEEIWKRVYTQLNLTDEEMDEHFAGPAFLAWARMGNIRGWGGPLPKSWHKLSVNLQHRILSRLREFGIIAVLPAFSGHVPRAFKRLFPDAQLTLATQWYLNATYCCPYLLEPTEPLFQTIGNMFMKELIDEFGTDHVYNCDTFNEISPNNGSESYLHDIGQSIYSAMATYDPKAIWLMQGWIFVNDMTFWTEDRAKALLTSVAQGKMIILDLQSEQRPQYYRMKSYFGQPFIWCMLHNFGGTLGMFGSVDTINQEVHAARNMEDSTMIGTGLTPEGINQNYIVYDLMSESSWRSKAINLTEWFNSYTIRRYGHKNTNYIRVWQILKNTLYNLKECIPMMGQYVLTKRPSTQRHPCIWYDRCDLLEAWNYLLQATGLQNASGYRYDLVDVTREVLQVLIDEHYKKIIESFEEQNVEVFQTTSTTFLDMFLDMEHILRSHKDFLLGNWLSAAKKLASNPHEAELYEYNARNQITLWGPNGELIDYANKQWSGMILDYYFKRWRVFINAMNDSLINQTPFDESSVTDKIFKEVEEPFTFSRKLYPEYPSGDTVAIAQEIRNKWWSIHDCSEEKFDV